MIQMTNGKKIYCSHGIETKAIRDMSFEIADGEFVDIFFGTIFSCKSQRK